MATTQSFSFRATFGSAQPPPKPKPTLEQTGEVIHRQSQEIDCKLQALTAHISALAVSMGKLDRSSMNYKTMLSKAQQLIEQKKLLEVQKSQIHAQALAVQKFQFARDFAATQQALVDVLNYENSGTQPYDQVKANILTLENYTDQARDVEQMLMHTISSSAVSPGEAEESMGINEQPSASAIEAELERFRVAALDQTEKDGSVRNTNVAAATNNK
jgi:hypothetical protein